MELHTLKRSKWIVSKGKRLWRGNSSWKGNYSGKGLKWQKARSGSSSKAFFEWGQTSIVQRIPKARGFKRYFKLIKEVAIVNLGHLEEDVRIIEWLEITKEMLKKLGYIKNTKIHVKILGNGDWTKKVTFVDIDSFSKTAQEKIANPSAKKESDKKKATAPKLEKSESKVVAKKATIKKEKVEKEEKAVKKPAAKKVTAEKPVKKPAAKKTSTKKTKAE